MEQEPKMSRLSSRTLRCGVLALVVAALLVFAGAALAQETTPQTEATSEAAPKPAAGLVVIHVAADSPAATAGVVRGDIILAVDDDAVNTMAELMHVISSHDAGDEIVLKVMHGDEERSLSVTLGDDDGAPLLGVMAVGDLAAEKKMDGWRMKDGGKPGRGQGRMPAMPFGRGQMPDLPGMPFGRDGQGMMWMEAASVEGAPVADVIADGPAASAGIQAGDVITGLNEAAVTSSDDLVALLSDHKPGDKVTVTYSRDDATASAEVTLGEHPDDATKAYMGVQLAPAGPARLRMQMGEGMIPGLPLMPAAGMMSGVIVADVTEDGPAAAAGLEKGDWITAVNGEAIDNPQALVDAVNGAKPGDEMTLTVQGKDDEEAADVTVTLGENADGGALLGVQIGGAMRIQRGADGMNFDFRHFPGQDGTPAMPFHWKQQDGGRNQTPDQNEQPAQPDARFSPQPDYATQGA